MSEDSSTQRVRLNKLIADSGLASRRHADRMIEEGQVTVNGKRVYELGVKVDPTLDSIKVNGKVLRKPLAQKLYLVFNKPAGVLTTMEDPEGRPTVAEYLGGVPSRVFPVGRLDWDSEGMILLTNDGDYANKVMHPKAEVTKTYLVKLDGQPQPHQLEKLRQGVSIIGGKVSARHIEKIKKAGDKKSDKYEWFKIVITEGKNRQIRQMFAKIGFDVIKLQRVAIGRLRLGALKTGALVYINEAAAERVFLADDPEELKMKKASPYAGRAPSAKKTAKPASRIRLKKEGGKTGYSGGVKVASKGSKK
ncbi:pseudouridine synthase [Bdellovibrio svalbardensis]|uniref:rRNA pseudouridine synthase n=1 Tax=Bdellovibrio svalbardensis TaxID=2972972 RepID=A0ABT6DF76_9BACT|nr:pseudouridine synthase [Bdellovibrio svalbardensis]MDG0815497.1 rRNA pseudouridine synthase [Bdellovibrio svalbardensis]